MNKNLTTPMLIIASIGVVSMALMCVVAVLSLAYGASASAVAINVAMLLFSALSNTMTGAFSSLYTLVKAETGVTLPDIPTGGGATTTTTVEATQKVQIPQETK